MDPFTHNLLGAIYQQEILEAAAKGRRGEHEWRWKFIDTVLEERQRIEEAGAFSTRTVSLRHQFSQFFSLLNLRRSARFAPQEITGQCYTDQQCAEY